MDKVIGSDMIGIFRPKSNAGSVIQPKSASFRLFGWNLQPFPSPDALNTLVIDMPARCPKEGSNTTVAITAILPGEFNNIRGQSFFIGSTMRDLPLCGTMLSQNPTGAAFRYAKRLSDLINTFATTGRAQKFPLAASLRICLSNVRSETA